MEEFPDYNKTADAGYMDEDDYLYIMVRIDDIINVAGHRPSTGGMEEALANRRDAAECAVIGIADREGYKTPATIDDPVILDEIGAILKVHGVLER